MIIKMSMSNKNNSFYAEALYENGVVTVKKGGYINPGFSTSIRGGKMSKKYRNDSNYVSEKYEIVKDCVFSSPSTAAQFVSGRSVDGYHVWKIAPKQNLGDYLKEKGLR